MCSYIRVYYALCIKYPICYIAYIYTYFMSICIHLRSFFYYVPSSPGPLYTLDITLTQLHIIIYYIICSWDFVVFEDSEGHYTCPSSEPPPKIYKFSILIFKLYRILYLIIINLCRNYIYFSYTSSKIIQIQSNSMTNLNYKNIKNFINCSQYNMGILVVS